MAYKIGILAAMRSELEPFLRLGLGGASYDVLAGRPIYTRQATYTTEAGRAISVEYLLMVCGVGKVRAASATQALIDRYQPDLVLNVGTAGGLRLEVAVGDIVISSKQHQHDSQLWDRFVCDSEPRIAEALYKQLAQLGVTRVHMGNGCAGDTFQAERSGKQQLAERFDAWCVDMESAAIADICAINGVPFCVVRSISDSLEGDENEFEQNHEQVSELVAKALAALLPELASKLDEILGQPMEGANQGGHKFVQIEAERLRLRRFRKADAEALWQYRADPEVARLQGWDSYSLEQAHALIKEMAAFDIGFAGTWFQIAIELKENGKLIGDIGVHSLADDPSQVELGFTLAKAYQGRGLATEALGALLDHLFGVMERHRVVAFTDPENTGAIKLCKRLGMRQEGHQRQSSWCNGEWRDDLQFAILREEWEARG